MGCIYSTVSITESMPYKQCPICHDDVFVASKKNSIRQHLLAEHNNLQQHQERACGAVVLPGHPDFRCLKCELNFGDLGSYYKHYAAAHGHHLHVALDRLDAGVVLTATTPAPEPDDAAGGAASDGSTG